LSVWELEKLNSEASEFLQQWCKNCKSNLKSDTVMELLTLNASVVVMCIYRANLHTKIILCLIKLSLIAYIPLYEENWWYLCRIQCKCLFWFGCCCVGCCCVVFLL